MLHTIWRSMMPAQTFLRRSGVPQHYEIYEYCHSTSKVRA